MERLRSSSKFVAANIIHFVIWVPVYVVINQVQNAGVEDIAWIIIKIYFHCIISYYILYTTQDVFR